MSLTTVTTSTALTEEQLLDLRQLLFDMDTSCLVDELIEAWSQDVNVSIQERYVELGGE